MLPTMPALPQSLKRPVHWTEVVAAVLALVGFIALSGSGHTDAAITLLVTLGGYDLLFALRRRQHRRAHTNSAQVAASGTVTTRHVQEAIKLWHTPEQVWSLIYPAENAALLSPDIARGYRVPGTPSGVGEQQAFIDVGGNTSVVEVIEQNDARRAVTKTVSPSPAFPLRTTVTLDPVADGCLMVYRYEYDVPASQALTEDQLQSWHEQARRYLEAVRHTLSTWQSSS
jgi:hypothetical protein